jgi:hypothetical protein
MVLTNFGQKNSSYIYFHFFLIFAKLFSLYNLLKIVLYRVYIPNFFFSGGMKDMYEEVIKFGADIVDALHDYDQPIIIYIPPFAELRGGSWVVIDPTINPREMEMYADPNSRGK